MNVDAHPAILGLIDACAGIGQLGESVCAGLQAVGFGSRVLAHIERDSAAASALRLRMEAAELDQALISDDMAGFDGRRFCGRVAGFCAGLPCPAFSTAGKRIGNFDPRAWGEDFDPDNLATWGPIPHAIRIIAESGAGFVFFENVPGWLRSGAYEPVGRELYGLGYTRQAAIFVSAEDAGAPHGRERGFVLAVSEQWRRWIHEQIGAQDRRTAAGRSGEELADGDGDERTQRRPDAGGRADRGALCDPGPADGGERVADPALGHGEPRPERIGMRAPGESLADTHGNGRFRAVRERREGFDVFAQSGAPMADAMQPRPQGAGPAEPPGRSGAGIDGDAVGNAERPDQGEGIQAEQENPGRRRGGSPDHDGGLPLYPPPWGTDLAAVAKSIGQCAAGEAIRSGDVLKFDARGSETRRISAAACRLARGIWRDWQAVARLDPTFMPAVESKISMVVDGYPYTAADLLRIGGNCVVADAATVAFVRLWRELVGGD